ncbi:MAG: hypothetical protein ACYCXW_14220 [Solirubrobacteraceae bacterium]
MTVTRLLSSERTWTLLQRGVWRLFGDELFGERDELVWLDL